MQEFFAAKRNYDQTEGRGPMVTMGIFTTVEPAYSLVKGQGVMGYNDGDIDVVCVFDTVDEMKQFEKGRSRLSDRVYSGWEQKWTPGYEIHDPRAADPEWQQLIEKQREQKELAAQVARLEAKFK